MPELADRSQDTASVNPAEAPPDLSSLFASQNPAMQQPQAPALPPGSAPPAMSQITGLPGQNSQNSVLPPEKKSSTQQLIDLVQGQLDKKTDPLESYQRIMDVLKKEKTASQQAKEEHDKIYGTGLRGSFNQILNAAGNVGNKDYKGTWDPILEQKNKEEQERMGNVKAMMPLFAQDAANQKLILGKTMDALKEKDKQENINARAKSANEIKSRLADIANSKYLSADEKWRKTLEYAQSVPHNTEQLLLMAEEAGPNSEEAEAVKKLIQLKTMGLMLDPAKRAVTPESLNSAVDTAMNSPRITEEIKGPAKQLFDLTWKAKHPDINPPQPLDSQAQKDLEHNSHNELDHLSLITRMMNSHPELFKSLGPWNGREGRFEEKIGGALPNSNETPEARATRLSREQEFRTEMKYLFLRELKASTTGRPNQTIIDELKKSSPNINMIEPFFRGAIKGIIKPTKESLRSIEKSYFGGKERPDWEQRLAKQYPDLADVLTEKDVKKPVASKNDPAGIL